MAATGGRTEIVDLLLEHGATIDVTNVGGTTPLYAATYIDMTVTARSLIEKGANVNYVFTKYHG